MLERFIESIERLTETIRKMIATLALYGIHRGEYHLRRSYHHQEAPTTSRGFARQSYWLRIRSNPYSRKRHRQQAAGKVGQYDKHKYNKHQKTQHKNGKPRN